MAFKDGKPGPVARPALWLAALIILAMVLSAAWGGGPVLTDGPVQLVGVNAAEAVMVGDSLTHDIAGARQIGMHAVLLIRSGTAPAQVGGGVPVIRTLHELPRVLEELARL